MMTDISVSSGMWLISAARDSAATDAVTKVNAAQTAGLGLSAANSTTSGSAAMTYSSPIYAYDSVTGAAILEYRDKSTGEILSQVPSKAALMYQQAQNL